MNASFLIKLAGFDRVGYQSDWLEQLMHHLYSMSTSLFVTVIYSSAWDYEKSEHLKHVLAKPCYAGMADNRC